MGASRGQRTAVVDIVPRGLQGQVEALLEQCRPALRDGTVLLAQAEGQVVGVAVLRLGAPEAEIRALVTDPNFRHKGAGRTLVAEMTRRARAAGCERLRIHLPRSDDAAHGFFRALGFEDTHVALDLVL